MNLSKCRFVVIRSVCTWLLAALLATLFSATDVVVADTVMRVTYRHMQPGLKTDFHITVDNSGGNPPGNKKLINRGANPTGSTAGWQNTPGAGNNTDTSADFDAGANGAGIGSGPNARGDFFIHNNTNYMKIKEAYFTPVDRDANNNIIQAISVGEKTTNYDFSVLTPGLVQFNPGQPGPIPFEFLIVKTGVSAAALAALSDPSAFANLTFSDFDSLPGTLLDRDADGGAIAGPLAYNGPALAAGTGAFVYLQSPNQFFLAWSDGVNVPEPQSIVLLLILLGSLLSCSRFRCFPA